MSDSISDVAGAHPFDDSASIRTRTSVSSTSVLAQLIHRPISVMALAWLLLLVFFTYGASFLAEYSPTAQVLKDTLQGPSASHFLGTDQLGRDLASRLMFGGQESLTGALIATVVSVLLGATVGLAAGYTRNWVGPFASGVADVLMSIPGLVILLSVAAVFARNQVVLMVVLGVLMSASVFRVVRAGTMDVRNELYIMAAKTSGLGDARIIFRHVLPRISGVIVVQTTIVASIAVVTQLGLGFLGIDVSPPTPSWGNMVKDASQSLGTSLWQIVPPTLVVALTVLAFSAIGDVTQQALTGRGRRSGLGQQRRARAGNHTTFPAGTNQFAQTPGHDLLAVDRFSLSVPGESGPLLLVDNVSFSIRPGEVVGLVGESGAGKSVMARSILGLLPYDAMTAGAITLEGNNLLAKTESQLAQVRGSEIAFISQEPMVSLSPSFTIGNQLAEIVRRHRRVGRRESMRIAIELLETVEIPNAAQVARKYPHQISGGMAQRVVIAIALSGEPRLIVADEPTTALDVSVQMQVLELLRRLQKSRSLAVLIVTHDWGVVADICDHAVVMYAGQIVEAACVDMVFNRPRHPYTAALRAADPHSQSLHARLVTIPGVVPQPEMWPSGCRFADRCSFVQDACHNTAVALTVVEPDHTARCLRAEELGALVHE